MHTLQRLLLILITCLSTTTLFAQADIDVVITGIDSQLEENVRLFLSLEQQKEHALMSEGRIRRLHKKAPQEIANALQPFGFYRPVISGELTQHGDTEWQASYNIDAGPPLPIAEFNLILGTAMSEDSEFQGLLNNLPLTKGDVFNHVKYENIKSSLARLASERGYFDAHFISHRVDINLDVYEARIQLNFNSGARYLFGEVILQQDVIDDELLRRYIPFEQGTPYNLNQLIDLQQALTDSDYFSTVEVSPGQIQNNNQAIPVSVILTPRKRHRFSIGAGYGSDTGARAKFGWQIPLLNSSGHRFDTETKVTEIGYSVAAHYRVPVLNPRTDQMIYSAGVVNEKTDTSDSTVRTIGASLKRSHNAWRESISINYQQEDYIIADVSGDSTLLMPGVNWSRVWGEGFIYMIDGLRFDIGLRGASKNLVSDTSFTQLQAGIKAINSINQSNRIINRGNLGSTWTSEFDQLPSSVRFFTGGAQSVRGYAYQSLGPVDANGNVIGGKHLMIGSIEFEHSFNSKWGAAVFYDGGNAIDSFSDNLQRGAGFGLRWKSPVGMVRIDMASALSLNGQPWRLHFNIGPDL